VSHALLPFLCFAPLRRGARVAIVSPFREREGEEPGFLDVRFEGGPGGADALVADVRDAASLAAARRAAEELEPDAPLILLDWRPAGLREAWRQARGGRAPAALGRDVRREFVLEPGLEKPRFLVEPGGEVPVEYGPAWRRALKRRGLFYFQRRHRALVLGPPTPPDFVSQVLYEVLGAPARVRRIYVSDLDTMVVAAEAGARGVYVRFPFGDDALARIARSHDVETRLRERGFTLAPEPLAFERDALCPFAAEGALDGAPPEEGLAAALEALRPVHEAFGRRVTLDEAGFAQHVGARLRTVERGTGRPAAAVERRLRDVLLGRRVLLTLCHGDFKLGNCLREDGRITGIVDWDTVSEDDLALVDVGNALAKLRQGTLETWRAALVEPDGEAARACGDWFRATETDPIPARELLLFWWLDRSSKHISGRVDPGGAWTKRHVAPLLDHV
jgi:hypothetical protein